MAFIRHGALARERRTHLNVGTIGSSTPADGKRRDVQVLRGISVVFVVLYHAGLPAFHAGYLGVDVFFVISGYLMAKMILVQIDGGRFSFGEFYLRRARRLLPAAYCTFALTSVASVFLLTEIEYAEYLKQLLGAVTFTANVFLWRQTGYFSDSAALKPLLHVWSLSLEEQFYLLLPLLLVLMAKSRRLLVIGAAFCLSLLACLILVEIRPSPAFFLLPTRAWELLAGSLCAVVQRTHPTIVPDRKATTLAVAVIVLVLIVGLDPVHPRLDAFLVTAATSAIVLGRFEYSESHLVSRCLEAIGDWSYSIYLVHWPLFAFAKNTCVGPLPAWAGAGLVGLSLGLGFVQYRLVECPFRADSLPRLVLLRGLGLAALALLVPIAAFTMFGNRDPGRDYAEIRRINSGLGPECRNGSSFTERPECMTSASPRLAVWGDSYALHLVPGLLWSSEVTSLVQITKPACGPTLGLAPVAKHLSRQMAESCIQFNQSVLKYLTGKDSIRIVVLSSSLAGYLDETTDHYLFNGAVRSADRAVMLERYVSTVAALRAIGKKVVIVAPPPRSGYDIGRCLERMETGKVVLDRNSCDFSEAEFQAQEGRVIDFLDDLEKAAAVTVLRPKDLLCKKGICAASLNGKFVYRDSGHLSYEGSREFAREFALGEKIAAFAR